MERYEQAFQQGEIDAEVLPELTDADLRELGVPVGPRKKLLKAIAGISGVDAAVADTPDSAAEAASAAGERRQVTILFADLSGYTRLSSQLDAEDMHALVGRFFERVDGIVEEYGGTVDKHMGDCVMAVFGAPVAHDNDPERAACAALEIRDTMPALSGAVGRRMGVHVGIAAGQVVASGTGSASHKEYTVTGDSVNLASRLTDRARDGEILISDGVRLAAARALRAAARRCAGAPGPRRAGGCLRWHCRHGY